MKLDEILKQYELMNDELIKHIEGAKSGYIRIQKIQGINNDKYPIGNIEEGYTNSFKEGIRCYISKGSRWFSTSIIKKIRWEDKEFDTIYSTYKFNFKENEHSNL